MIVIALGIIVAAVTLWFFAIAAASDAPPRHRDRPKPSKR